MKIVPFSIKMQDEAWKSAKKIEMPGMIAYNVQSEEDEHDG